MENVFTISTEHLCQSIFTSVLTAVSSPIQPAECSQSIISHACSVEAIILKKHHTEASACLEHAIRAHTN